MKIAFTRMALATVMFMSAAHAATVTVAVGTDTYKGWKLSGLESLSFSADVLGALDTAKVTATGNGTATANVSKDSDGYYLTIQAKTPITTLTVDDTSDQVQSSTAAGGGLTLTSPVLRSVTSGGSLTISDLKVDLASKKVYATIVGANGVGTVPNVYIWDFTTATLPSTLTIAANTGQPNNTLILSGLSITADGFNQFVKSLGFLSLGKAALSGVVDYGTIAVKVDPVLDSGVTPPPPPTATCAVSYKAVASSSTTFDATVTVSNNSTNTASDWRINWTYGAPTLVLSVKSVSLTNTNSVNITATPASTNKVILAGTSKTFSLHASTRTAGLPAVSKLTATLGGQLCSVTAE